MINFRTSLLAKTLALGLVLAMYIIPSLGSAVALAAEKKQSVPIAKKTVTLLVLPFDKTVPAGPDSLGMDTAVAVKSALDGKDRYFPISFNSKLPSVQRAISDGTLAKKDADGPFSEDKPLAAKIGRAVGAEVVVTGSIEDIKIDLPNNSAEIKLNVHLVSAETGEVINTITISGKNSVKPETPDEESLISLAAGDAAVKLAVEIAKDQKLAEVVPVRHHSYVDLEPKKKSSSKYLWIALILGLGLALAGGGGGGGSSSGGGDDLPPPPP